MRWYIVRTLLYKEALRHATNRGGLLLAALLVTASLVMSALNPAGEKSGPQLIGGIHHCYLHIQSDESPWARHLQSSLPPELKKHVFFQKLQADIGPQQEVVYPPGTGAIQIRDLPPGDDGRKRYAVLICHPAGDRVGMSIYEKWFYRETYRFWHQQAAEQLQKSGIDPAKRFAMPSLDKDDLWEQRLIDRQMRQQVADLGGTLPEIEYKENPTSGSSLDMHAAMATSLVMFALFFTCVYLMPSLTCEERERGLLLAQALSPARVARSWPLSFCSTRPSASSSQRCSQASTTRPF